MKSGWSSHPDAAERQRDFPPVEPGRVVGLGALCDLVPPYPDQGHAQSFHVGEFVTLEDGRRVTLHDERGLTIGGVRSTGGPVSPDIRDHLTPESLTESMTRDVLRVVLPDPDDGEEHPWEWLAGLARARGLDVSADGLRGLPYVVVFTEEVRRWLARG